jgi:uncharacterized protein (DUF1800 family)
MIKHFHALRRLCLGFTRADLEQVRRDGVERFIQAQLDPGSLPEPPVLQAKLAALPSLRLGLPDLYHDYGPPNRRAAKASAGEVQRRGRQPYTEAATAKLWRALHSPRQLQELLVDFWFGHFNVFMGKGLPARVWVGAYERDAIRPFVLGRFRDLLFATARHPAMLLYLDNQRNIAPTSLVGRMKQRGLNENYARELMELHTLGVDGGYGQQDVRELARILTGWGLKPAGPEQGPSLFFFEARRHDFGEKTLLGRKIPGKGQAEVEETLEFLASHPSTARHVTSKLARLFVADDPPPALVDRLARRFLDTGGDLRAVLAALFASGEFWDERYYGAKFKTPFQYLVSSLRLVESPAEDARPLLGLLRQWGMAPFGCPTPDGYSDRQDAWLNPDAVMRRIDFATGLAHAKASPPGRPAFDLAPLRPLCGARTLAAIDEAPEPMRLALWLSSPEFLRR